MAFLTQADLPPLSATVATPYPTNLTRLEGLDLSARYHSDRWGGDFFDAVTVESRVVFLLTDIAGTRAEAHAIAAQVQLAFRQQGRELFGSIDVNESVAMATLAHQVNRSLMEAAGGVRFAPTFLGCFNLDLGILTYCNAGQLLAVFADGKHVQVLERGGVPLGLFTHVTYEPTVVAFEPGDRLLLVTKGVTESRRGSAEFGARRIQRLLQHSEGFSASRLCDDVLRHAYGFGNHPVARVYDFLLSRKQRSQEDMTAVALVRT